MECFYGMQNHLCEISRFRNQPKLNNFLIVPILALQNMRHNSHYGRSKLFIASWGENEADSLAFCSSLFICSLYTDYECVWIVQYIFCNFHCLDTRGRINAHVTLHFQATEHWPATWLPVGVISTFKWKWKRKKPLAAAESPGVFLCVFVPH